MEMETFVNLDDGRVMVDFLLKDGGRKAAVFGMKVGVCDRCCTRKPALVLSVPALFLLIFPKAVFFEGGFVVF